MPQQTCTEYIPGEEPRTWVEDVPTVEVPIDVQPPGEPATTMLEVDPVALGAALTRGQTATTLAQNRQAWADLAAALSPTD